MCYFEVCNELQRIRLGAKRSRYEGIIVLCCNSQRALLAMKRRVYVMEVKCLVSIVGVARMDSEE